MCNKHRLNLNQVYSFSPCKETINNLYRVYINNDIFPPNILHIKFKSWYRD